MTPERRFFVWSSNPPVTSKTSSPGFFVRISRISTRGQFHFIPITKGYIYIYKPSMTKTWPVSFTAHITLRIQMRPNTTNPYIPIQRMGLEPWILFQGGIWILREKISARKSISYGRLMLQISVGNVYEIKVEYRQEKVQSDLTETFHSVYQILLMVPVRFSTNPRVVQGLRNHQQ